MKIISVTLICSLLFATISCTRTRILHDKDEMRDCLEDQSEISITTYQNNKYGLYLPNTYKFKNDTIFGLQRDIQWNKRTYHSIKIPFYQIQSIERKRIDPVNTILLIGGIVGIIIAISNIQIGFDMNFR